MYSGIIRGILSQRKTQYTNYIINNQWYKQAYNCISEIRQMILI